MYHGRLRSTLRLLSIKVSMTLTLLKLQKTGHCLKEEISLNLMRRELRYTGLFTEQDHGLDEVLEIHI